MDPVKISSPFKSVSGPSLWLPFDCVDIKTDGAYAVKPAKDLPSFTTKDAALTFMTNNPQLDKRPLQWIEHTLEEIESNPELKAFAQRTLWQRFRNALRPHSMRDI
jgi:hypothetical protein